MLQLHFSTREDDRSTTGGRLLYYGRTVFPPVVDENHSLGN
jgi:hypothetical protein